MALGFLARRVAKREVAGDDARRDDRRDIYEMANLFPGTTGLPVTVWVSPRDRARHAARIKANTVPGNRMDTAGTASVAIDPTPHLIAGTLDDRYLEPVQRWIALNRDMLIRYWNGEIDTGTLFLGLKRLD